MNNIKKNFVLTTILISFLSSCTIHQEGVSLWNLKQFRDGRITLFDINNDKIQDLIVAGYQKGGKLSNKKVMMIENDLKSLEIDTGKWQGRGYSFYIDNDNQLWSKGAGKSEKVKNNVFRSNISAVVTDDGNLQILYNDKKVESKEKKWEIPGLKLWVDDGNRLWIQEDNDKTVAPRGRWHRKLNVFINSLSEWIKATGYKRGGKVDKDGVPIGDSLVAIDGKTQKIFWKFQTNAALDNYPSVYEDKVYIGGQDKTFYAVDLSTGKLRWRFPTSATISTTACIGKDIVYFANTSGYVYALNASNGSLVWSFKAKGAIESSPALYENKIFFGSWDKNFYALDARNGRLVWKQELTSYIGKSSPLVYDEKVIIGSWDKSIYAFDVNTGRSEWTFKTDDWIDKGSPSAGGGLIFIGNKRGNFYALNSATGSMKWQFDAGDAIASTPVVTKNRVYVTSRDGYLYALNRSTGEKVWEDRTRFKIFSSPAVAENKVYISSMGGFINAFVDTAMGKPYWSMAGGDPTHKSNVNASLSYSKKLLASKTFIDKLLEENGLVKAN